MASSARQLEETQPLTFGDVAVGLLGLVARNPVLVGGTTAFLVALSFVSANALWYQPHAHSSAFFSTRELLRTDVPEPVDETTILIERPQEKPELPKEVVGDPVLKSIQATLKQLNFYGGDVDGLYGPATRVAIEAYQSKMGLAVTGVADETLADLLGTRTVTSSVVPSPAPRNQPAPRVEAASSAQAEPAAASGRDERVARVQAGLREFGNEAIEVDGLMGAKTKAAIREFQSLFGLAETGDVNAEVVAKMKEIGLVQ